MIIRFSSSLLFIFLITSSICFAQQQYTEYQELEGSIQIGPTEEIALDKTARGYTLLLPDYEKEIRGLIVVFEGRRITLSNIPEDMIIHPHAFRRGLGVLYVSTGNPVNFFFEEESMITVKNLIKGASKKHNIPLDSLFYTGMSIGGTQALKFTIFCKKKPKKCDLAPDAVALVDSPLDMKRFWHATERAEKVDFHPIGAGEGVWVSYWLEKNLEGTPHENPQAYMEYSPYTYTAENTDNIGGNAKFLADVPIRAYHEPDVNWWIKNRRYGYYSMNSIDLAGLINALKILGNEDAQLVTTHNQRDNLDESPHTWSIVNNAKLLKWFASYIEKK
ncbi:MAG: hypothetical protein GVY20_06410 [Bacteroidetes bacterium]|jgi:hypothetical protein|nr:hypothetical protein [Bacteroidota bacterium]